MPVGQEVMDTFVQDPWLHLQTTGNLTILVKIGQGRSGNLDSLRLLGSRHT